jgi:cytochrome c-type biogenesis protein CcmE
MSVRQSSRSNSAIAGWISVKFGIGVFLVNLSEKIKFYYNMTKMTGTLRED